MLEHLPVERFRDFPAAVAHIRYGSAAAGIQIAVSALICDP